MTGDSRRIGRTKRLLAEDVFQHLGMAIVTGELAPKQRIRDADIALQLHVSRMPIREALQRLERIGLVTMYPSRYTEVTAITDKVVQDSQEFAALQAGFVARLAAVRMTQADRVALVQLFETLDERIDDPLGYVIALKALFGRLSTHADNALLDALLRETSVALARNLTPAAPDPELRDAVLGRHATLHAALESGDPDAAEQAARALFEA